MSLQDRQKYLRQIPAVNTMLEQKRARDLIDSFTHTLVAEAAAEVARLQREKIMAAEIKELDNIKIGLDSALDLLEQRVRFKARPNLRKVINATGIVLHTNLGRALLARPAVEAVLSIADSYNNLELDLATGERGSRYVHVEELLCKITGAEGALVVNNNAAAVLLVLNTFAQGREVIVSRGQLVEIGGSFRVPDVMSASGAALVEVGTTNKTHLKDYSKAINENTAILLRVHTSNYKVVGFTNEVSNRELVELGNSKGIPVIEDLGSGVLVNLKKFGLPEEPTVQEVVQSGVDVVTFSGDKLFGGPQAGIIVGKKHYIDKMKQNPMTRALRVDKFTFAALEATLRLYIDEEQAVRNIPTLEMLSATDNDLAGKARRLARRLRMALKEKAVVRVVPGFSQVGGGALPTADIPSKLIAIEPEGISVSHLEERLRAGEIPVLARIHKDQLLLDVRTIRDNEIPLLVKAIDQVF